MGWQEAEAQTALRRSGHDVGAAAGLLETEEEERKELMAKVWTNGHGITHLLIHILTVAILILTNPPHDSITNLLLSQVKEVVQIGNWNPEAAEAAVRQCETTLVG